MHSVKHARGMKSHYLKNINQNIVVILFCSLKNNSSVENHRKTNSGSPIWLCSNNNNFEAIKFINLLKKLYILSYWKTLNKYFRRIQFSELFKYRLPPQESEFNEFN